MEFKLKHTFRLQGPWYCRFFPLGKMDVLNCDDSPEKKVKLPASWQKIFGINSGLASFRRTFNLPSAMEKNEKLRLLVENHGSEISLDCCQSRIQADLNINSTSFILPDYLPASPEITLNLKTDENTNWQNEVGLWKPVILQIIEYL